MLKRLVRLLNNSSLLVAIAAAALTVESFILCGTPIRIWLVVEVFFITWCGYVFLRREERTPDQKSLIYIAVTGSVICFFMTDFLGWQILLLSGAIVFLYNLSEQNLPRFARIIPRKITFLKPASVGAAWALTTSALPASLAYYHHEIAPAAMIFSNFFFITALAVCDDIRDMNRDNGKIKTLPLALGLKTTRAIIVIHLAAAAALFCYTHEYHVESITYTYLSCMALITILMLNIKPQGNWQIQALIIDGSILLRAVAIALVALSS